MSLARTYTPLYLANATGLTYAQVLRDIRVGELVAVHVRRGTRGRWYIHPADADRWLRQLGLGDLVQLEIHALG